MRIISDFKDYYDCLQSYDQDRETLYIRKPKTIVYKKYDDCPFPKATTCCFYWSKNSGVRIDVRQYIVGFCGKIYPILYMSNYKYLEPRELCFNLTDVNNFIRANTNEIQYKTYSDKRKQNFSFYRDDRQQGFKAFFEDCETKKSSYIRLFEDEHSPIFVAELNGEGHVNQLTFNTNLKPLEFYKLFNASQAYQEILMFFNNLAVPMKPIPKLDDVTMAESKGFDKYSFRKDKIKRKGKK